MYGVWYSCWARPGVECSFQTCYPESCILVTRRCCYLRWKLRLGVVRTHITPQECALHPHRSIYGTDGSRTQCHHAIFRADMLLSCWVMWGERHMCVFIHKLSLTLPWAVLLSLPYITLLIEGSTWRCSFWCIQLPCEGKSERWTMGKIMAPFKSMVKLPYTSVGPGIYPRYPNRSCLSLTSMIPWKSLFNSFLRVLYHACFPNNIHFHSLGMESVSPCRYTP